MIDYIRRLRARVRRWRSLDADLNDRARVELRLWATVSGKKPAPDAEECRQMAIRLGVPAEYRKHKQEERD